ncbi:MAG: chondroitinase-B domain-containing protein [Paludibacter sp.]|nr:chondroitinase-B domain-containing protein [Paludibacter sp.]
MKKRLNFLIVFAFLASATLVAKNYKVMNMDQLNEKIKTALPGDSIVMANGVWNETQIKFKANGKKDKFISLKAEKAGKVFIEGKSSLAISGSWLHVSGLVFRNGHTPGRTVIEFKTDARNYANHCVVSNCVIDNYNQETREKEDNWIAFWGKYNTVEYCYLGGKSNVGTTLIVCPNDSNSIHNKHLIYRNYFGARPRLGSNGGESIRLGTSQVCTFSSETTVEGNYFEHCNGEVEIISNKSCDNRFLNNTLFESEGSLVLRHGNRAIVAGNWFIGNGKPFTGGVRVINEGHHIYNNFFYKLRGDEFRSPLTIMNGIPNSEASGYAPVRDVILSNNTFMDCTLPWNFCVGVGERNRIVTPQNTQIINNIVYCPNENELVKSYDKTDGIAFGNNLMISKKGNLSGQGNLTGEIIPSKIGEQEMVYSTAKAQKVPFIKTDILGQLRTNGVIGAFQGKGEKSMPEIASSTNCGPAWYKPASSTFGKGIQKGKNIKVEAGTDNLFEAVKNANSGDILLLTAGEHFLTKKLVITKNLTIKAASKLEAKPVIIRKDLAGEEPLFELTSGVTLRVKGVKMDGAGDTNTAKYAFATGEHALNYSLFVDNCEISNFKGKGSSVFNSLYCTFADSIIFSNSVIRDSYSGINLHKEKEDGRYNAETVILSNTVFANISDYALDYYRGGNDESTVGGSLAVNHCVFDSVGNGTKESILSLSRIMFVKINNSIISNSTAKSSVQLWGLYNKISNCCLYNCAKPEFTREAKSKNLTGDNPLYAPKSYLLSENSPLIGKATDSKNIGLKK